MFEAKDMSSLHKAFLWKSQCNTALVDWLQKNSVNLILSTGCIDDTLHTWCLKAGILMVQFVDKEDFERLKMLFHISAIEFLSDLFEVPNDYIGCSEVCEAEVFGQKRFVCLKFPDHDQSGSSTTHNHVEGLHSATKFRTDPECLRRQLVICGMSAGACQQIRLDLLHALKSLRLWLDSKWLNAEASLCSAVHIAGGGSFELICYDTLQDFMKRNALELGYHVTVFCEALSAALLAVPLRLLQNSFQPKLATVFDIRQRILSSRTSGVNIYGFDGCNGRQLQADTSIIEPVMSKILLLDHVLELTEQLLRISALLHVKSLKK